MALAGQPASRRHAPRPGDVGLARRRRQSPRCARTRIWREFFELFALGIGNYTEQDIRETARALTGWQEVIDNENRMVYSAGLHDAGEKTILGQSGPWAEADVVRIACAHPASARRIAWRLWRTFVSDVDEPTPELLEGLAATMRSSGEVDTQRGLETLLRSRLFHSPAYVGRRVLSPIEWTVTVLRVGETFPPRPDLTEIASHTVRMGQRLFQPPNVAGWPGGLEWLTGAALVARENFAAWLTSGEAKVPLDHWSKLSERYAIDGDARIDFWTALCWGRVPQADERSSAAELLASGDAKDSAKLFRTLDQRSGGASGLSDVIRGRHERLAALMVRMGSQLETGRTWPCGHGDNF